MSALHEMALAYAQDGTPVFPCEENGKKPITKNGFKDATTDIEQINKWWSENPNYNLAFSPEDAGLFVVDIDPGTEADILEKLVNTHRVQTPRGGYHYYYKGSGKTTASKIALHVDTRGEGGYVLAPPSKINGIEYKVEQKIDYAPIPQWIIEKLAVVGTPMKAAIKEKDLSPNIDRAKQVLQKYVDTGDVAIEGQGGDARTFRLCCEMLDLGLSVETAQDLIDEIWNDHCMPPWAPDEIQVKLRNAQQYMRNEAGAFAVNEPKEVFGHAVRNLHAEQKEETEKPFLYIRDRETQLNSPQPEMQIETILPARKVIMITGERGSGKTYVALEILTAIAMNRPAFGQYKVLKPGPVVAFLGEDPREVEHSRLVATEKHYNKSLQGSFYSIETAIPLDDQNLFEKYCDELRRLEKKIGKIAGIFNDTLKRSLGSLNPNDAQTGMLFTSVNEKLATEFDCSIICNAHPPKNGGTEASIAGTGSFVDNVSVTLNLARTSEKPFDIRCSFEPKYRIGPRPEPFVVRATTVQLPKPVAGVTTDLIFTALSPDQARQSASSGMAARAEFAQLQNAFDLFKAHSLATGLTTKGLAEALAGDPKNYKNEDDYRQTVGKHYNRLDQGTRSRKLSGGRQSKPKFEAWFDRDYRDDPIRGIVKWWGLSPDDRVASQETEMLYK